MVTITTWMYLIIPGFVYLSASFFIFLYFAKIYEIKINTGIKEYLPYIAILLIFISYVIGHCFNLALERILFWICPNIKNAAITLYENKHITNHQIESIKDGYASLVMIRHLIISTIALGISFIIWIRKTALSKFKSFAIFTVILLEAIFILAYLGEREIFNNLKNAP